MARTYYGDPFDTAEMSNTAKSIRLCPGDNVVLRGIRTWLIFNNHSGSITNMQCKIYSDRSSSPGALIATSTTSLNRADIITQANGVKEIYFTFDDISLHSNTYYHFVINCTGYTGTDNSHIAWRKAWPDPVYRGGWTQSFENLAISPYFITLIGAPL